MKLMLAQHWANVVPTLAQYKTNVDPTLDYNLPMLAQHVGPTSKISLAQRMLPTLAHCKMQPLAQRRSAIWVYKNYI